MLPQIVRTGSSCKQNQACEDLRKGEVVEDDRAVFSKQIYSGHIIRAKEG
jgi:hypothetical protein